jgi:hypothetical protein
LIGSAFQVNTNTTAVTSHLSVAGLANGDFVVTWADDNGQTATIEDQIFSIAPPTVSFPFANNNDITEAVYIGYYGRAGDPVGDSYWLIKLGNGNISETGMAASFSVQPESTALYSFLANPSTASQAQITSFIESVYGDLFNRTADPSGLAYWQHNLTSNLGNPQEVGAFILNVISGAGGSDQTTIANKVTVADYFTQQLATDGISYDSSADTLAHSVIASVTGVASSVLAAETTINTFLSMHGL